MNTAEKNAKNVQGTTAGNNNAPRTENRPNITGKEAKQDETTKDAKPAEAPKVEADTNTQAAPVPAVTVDNKPADPATGPAKGEVKYIKPALNLEQTLKSVGNLHRLTIQRLALIGRIKTLEDFEVQLVEENDQLENNPYQGCKLIVKDDKGREFTTNTPGLIRLVTQFIFDACHEKLAEIEANIVFPQQG